MEIGQLYQEHRSVLMAIAYRMLGSHADAEDVIQDVFIDFQRQSLDQLDNVKAYLIRSVTNRCINLLQSARKRREIYTGPWLPEPQVTWYADTPEESVVRDEQINYAFFVMMEQLNPLERALFILREVLGYEYAEIGRILNRSEVNCRQILSRLKRKLKQDDFTANPTVRQADELLNLFKSAARSGDFIPLIRQLTADATLVMDGGGKVRGALRPIIGSGRIQALFEGILPRGFFAGTLMPVQIHGTPGYVLVREQKVLWALTFGWNRQGKISRIFVVTNPDKLAQIPLPE